VRVLRSFADLLGEYSFEENWINDPAPTFVQVRGV